MYNNNVFVNLQALERFYLTRSGLVPRFVDKL